MSVPEVSEMPQTAGDVTKALVQRSEGRTEVLTLELGACTHFASAMAWLEFDTQARSQRPAV